MRRNSVHEARTGFAPRYDAEVSGAAGLAGVCLAGWFDPEHFENLKVVRYLPAARGDGRWGCEDGT